MQLSWLMAQKMFLHGTERTTMGILTLKRLTDKKDQLEAKSQENCKFKKGIYPYEYIDSWGRFSETRLPDKEKFYSKLNDEHITDDEYTHA